ncbi:mechanosensitive ion channel [Propioniciclava coleopterorum]|uniref:Mechanosensitive ion channel n=1 Tax=Propioniciclava coleopterorum TaxID=2714937 RepID=A0A6G7Y6T8_9ACTN|nr:mechanosensitive ion channel family protein [Propioniciclava coleopterorum]QIK72341.1 mechanosensitive ion channel [Propioniciclava coleopterorum]
MTPLITATWPDTAIEIGVVLLIAIVARFVLRRAIRTGVNASVKASEQHKPKESRADKVLGHLSGALNARHEARVKTVGSVLSNAVDVILIVLVALTILRILGVPLEPVLAASGIGGVALAFGAQSLVRDYISGILMIFEDQFGVGDLIDTGEAVGTVQEVGLRVTKLVDVSGQVWYVRNGEIQRVGNRSQGWSTATIDIPIAPGQDTARAVAVLNEVVDRVFDEKTFGDVLLERPSVLGVNKVTPGVITLTILAKTAPNQQWALQRDLLAKSVRSLQDAGIRSAVPEYPVAPPHS